jgi:hypothetical protein
MPPSAARSCCLLEIISLNSGQCSDLPTRGEKQGKGSHAWVEVGGVVLDITGDQSGSRRSSWPPQVGGTTNGNGKSQGLRSARKSNGRPIPSELGER